MTSQEATQIIRIAVGGAQVHLKSVRLRDDVTVDEIHLNGSNIRIESPRTQGETVKVQADETRFDIIMSEANINRVLAANEQPDALARNLRIALLSGKARVTGQIVKAVLHLPFTIEGVPRIENGVRVKLDFQAVRAGISMPAPVVDVIEQFFNNNQSIPLDLSRLPFPVCLDEIRCEPGRLSVSGRARLSWPIEAAAPTAAPFTAADSTKLDHMGAPAALSSGAEETPALPPATS